MRNVRRNAAESLGNPVGVLAGDCYLDSPEPVGRPWSPAPRGKLRTDAMNRALVYTVNGLLIGVCCWLVAGIAISVAESMTATETAAVAPPPASGPQGRDWSERQAILTRNLFNSDTLAPAVVQVPAAERLPETKLALRLLGTAASSVVEESWAAVEDKKSREHQVVRIGDEILDARVVGIDPRRIVIENRGRREELALEEDPTDSARSATRRTAARNPRASVQRVGRNRFQVDPGRVAEIADNPAALFSQARIIPRYEDGQMTGVQLNAIKPGSLFEQAGLEDGDVVIELNGIAATSQEASQQILSGLRTDDEWNLRVRDRNGNEKTLEFVK